MAGYGGRSPQSYQPHTIHFVGGFFFDARIYGEGWWKYNFSVCLRLF
jgi:hypothetical protein